ncbi:MAG: hypothetical protein O7G86_15115 [Gammaproteobacteria bacterium]|nr:hypothetical protein [Gammaproteobacteria bacterium]
MKARLRILVFGLCVTTATACDTVKPPMAGFEPPDDAQPPATPFIGRLTMTPVQLKFEEYVRAAFFDPVSDSLPEFSFNYVSDGTHLIPFRRGLIPSVHPQFDFLLSPGRIWQDGDAVVHASLPFTLMSRGGNCTHNGLLRFTLENGKEGDKQSGSFLINQETCHFLKFDMWGPVSVVYTPNTLPEAERIVAEFRREVANRVPTRPYSDFARNYPAVDLDRFSVGLP